MPKVAIDAGHGSNTAGKRTPDGYREHWFNVSVSLLEEIAFKRCGFETLRIAWDDANAKDDNDLSLTARINLIKANKCDYSVSNHYNASGSGKTYNSAEGICTIFHSYPSRAKDSRSLAVCVQNELIKGTKQKNRGVNAMALSMCRADLMRTKASILIEFGFMTNRREAELMRNIDFVTECAEEVVKGFCKYANVQYIPPKTQQEMQTTQAQTTGFELVFNAQYYSDKYNDLKFAFGNNENLLFEHFINCGMKESRQAISTFNVKVYREKNADLQNAFGDDYPLYYLHYINIGHKENRITV